MKRYDVKTKMLAIIILIGFIYILGITISEEKNTNDTEDNTNKSDAKITVMGDSAKTFTVADEESATETINTTEE